MVSLINQLIQDAWATLRDARVHGARNPEDSPLAPLSNVVAPMRATLIKQLYRGALTWMSVLTPELVWFLVVGDPAQYRKFLRDNEPLSIVEYQRIRSLTATEFSGLRPTERASYMATYPRSQIDPEVHLTEEIIDAFRLGRFPPSRPEFRPARRLWLTISGVMQTSAYVGVLPRQSLFGEPANRACQTVLDFPPLSAQETLLDSRIISGEIPALIREPG